MRKILLIILCIFLFEPKAAAAEKSEEELLRETAALSKEVKEFGKTIGIEPSAVLTKTALEAPRQDWLVVMAQKRGTLALHEPIEMEFWLYFSESPRKIIQNWYLYNKSYSIYTRLGEQLADKGSTITPDFAKEELMRKVDVILHEDLHMNTEHLRGTINQEAIITPLATLAALKFFEYAEDRANYTKTEALIQRYRAISRELNDFVKTVLDIFLHIPEEEWYEKIFEIAEDYPNYMAEFRNIGESLNQESLEENRLEAKISYDYLYHKYFDRVVALYEKCGDLKLLIADLKKSPAETSALEAYLAELEKKYGSR
ncbi:MAG: hypothetical protein HYT98_03055 [Candidatus Sungbacteria bacterium]|nr:hypothetical protein [Candidatus Sungbacteria bacterium]